MGSQTAPNVTFLKGGNARIFVQIDPTLPPAFYGCAAVDGISQSLGDSTPIYCPSTVVPNQWDIVDQIPAAKELGSGNLTQKAEVALSEAWWNLKRINCEISLFINVGTCNRPDDPNGWDSKIALGGVRLTEFGIDGTLNPASGGDNAEISYTLPFSFREIYPIRPIIFQEFADSTLLADILDGLWYDVVNCGSCGSPSDGTKRLYLLTAANTGSPGLSSQILRTVNGGQTWVAIDIPVLSGTSANRMAAMGSRLIVISQNLGGYAWSEFTDIDAGTPAWSAVTTGFVAGKAPRAIFAKSSFETFVAGAGGYLYFINNAGDAPSRIITDGSLTTQDFNDVHGSGKTVVAVGNSNAMIRSYNAGDSFALVTGPAVGVNLNGVWVQDRDFYFVAANNGKLYRTVDGGTTWTQVSLPASLTTINDIRFFDNNIGYLSAEGGGAKVYRSTDGGVTWENTQKIKGLPTAQRINVVIPNPYDPNVLAVGGRKTVGGDGLLAIAK